GPAPSKEKMVLGNFNCSFSRQYDTIQKLTQARCSLLELLQWLTSTNLGEMFFTMLVSMVPIIELRGGVPFGTALGLPPGQALVASIIGNMIPIPFIIVYIRRIFLWMRRKSPKL